MLSLYLSFLPSFLFRFRSSYLFPLVPSPLFQLCLLPVSIFPIILSVYLSFLLSFLFHSFLSFSLASFLLFRSFPLSVYLPYHSFLHSISFSFSTSFLPSLFIVFLIFPSVCLYLSFLCLSFYPSFSLLLNLSLAFSFPPLSTIPSVCAFPCILSVYLPSFFSSVRFHPPLLSYLPFLRTFGPLPLSSSAPFNAFLFVCIIPSIIPYLLLSVLISHLPFLTIELSPTTFIYIQKLITAYSNINIITVCNITTISACPSHLHVIICFLFLHSCTHTRARIQMAWCVKVVMV